MGYRILVVDDQKDDLDTTKLFLKKIMRDENLAADVLCVTSGDECRRVLQEEGKSIDIILLDLNMPRENGARVQADISSLCKDYQIQVYLYTAVFDKTKLTDTLRLHLVGDVKQFMAFDILQKRDLEENAKTIIGALYFRDAQTHMLPDERQEYWSLEKAMGKAGNIPHHSESQDPKVLKFHELNFQWQGQREMAEKIRQKRKALE